MTSSSGLSLSRDHANNIGVLRLLFASLVIIGHAPEMVDGDRGREPLISLFHTVSLGELSVDAFFLLSGYLITASFRSSTGLGSFLRRRVLRIFPGFVVAYALCVAVLCPITGGDPTVKPLEALLRLVTLQPPMDYPGQLAGVRHYPLLNGAVWTIAYEFRCYLLTAALGCLGLFRDRRVILWLTAAVLACTVLASMPFAWRIRTVEVDPLTRTLLGAPMASLRFVSIYLVGSCFQLFSTEIRPRLTPAIAAGSAVLAAATMYRTPPGIAEAGLVIFGGCALFWLALTARLGSVQRINHTWDVSYGTYLYGWPVAMAVLWVWPSVDPWTLAAIVLPSAMACGAVSWWMVECPAKALRLRRALAAG
jgi:peptidoglycan/LPS O-acetylase OafA/YrhL